MTEERKVWLARMGKEGPEVLEVKVRQAVRQGLNVHLNGRTYVAAKAEDGLPIYQDWSFGWTEEEAYAKEVRRLWNAADEAFGKYLKMSRQQRQFEDWGYKRYVEKKG